MTLIVVLDPLDRDARLSRHSGGSSGVREKVSQRFVGAELVNCGIVDTPGDSCLGSGGRDVDDIAREQSYVGRLVPSDQKCIKIEVRCYFVAATKLNLAKGAL